MPPHDIEIIHSRISDLKDTVADLTIEVRRSIALCDVCRPKVLGNGNEGFGSRLARAEESNVKNGENRVAMLEATKAVSAWWITKIMAACTVVSTILSAIISIALHFFQNS